MGNYGKKEKIIYDRKTFSDRSNPTTPSYKKRKEIKLISFLNITM